MSFSLGLGAEVSSKAKKLKRMVPSVRVAKIIMEFEALRTRAYKLPGERYYSIGYGHSGPDIKAGDTISEYDAVVLLGTDVLEFGKGVFRLLKRQPTQNQFDAMVSLAFNVGVARFATSTILNKFNQGLDDEASEAFLLYTKARGPDGKLKPLPGLEKRRAREKEIFMEPDGDLFAPQGGVV